MTTSSPATRARTARSVSRTPRRASAFRSASIRARARPPGRARAAWSRASSCPADASASGATPGSCARSSAARSRSCGARSSRSSPPRSPGSSRPGRASRARGPASTPCSRRSSSSRAARSRRPCSRPRSSPRGSSATGRRTSTSCWLRERSSGAASSRSARATGGSRSTWPTALRFSLRRPANRRRGQARAEIRVLLSRARRAVLPGPRRRDRRLPGDLVTALWDLVWAGEVTNDTLAPLRSLLSRFRPRRAPGARAGRSFRPGASARPGARDAGRSCPRRGRRRPRPSGARRSRGPARAPRRPHARSGGRRGNRRRLLRGLPGAQGDGGGGPGPPRLLRRRPRRDAVRAGGRRRSAAGGARCRRSPRRRRPLVLAATDPANPYGAALPWPAPAASEPAARPQRAAGAQVVTRAGELLAWIGRTETESAELSAAGRAGARRRGPRSRPGPGGARRNGTNGARCSSAKSTERIPRVSARTASRRGGFSRRLSRLPQAPLAPAPG